MPFSVTIQRITPGSGVGSSITVELGDPVELLDCVLREREEFAGFLKLMATGDPEHTITAYIYKAYTPEQIDSVCGHFWELLLDYSKTTNAVQHILYHRVDRDW